MKHLFLIVFITFISFDDFAQTAIRAFEDYRTCRTGFISEKGDTIWKAVFDKTRYTPSMPAPDYYGWYVSQNEKEGLINNKGKLLIPCKYDQIVYYPKADVIRIDSAGLSCVKKSNLEDLIPYKYAIKDIYSYQKRVYYHVLIAGKEQLLDDQLNPIMPSAFSSILLTEKQATGELDDYILVTENGKTGAYNWNGICLFPPEYLFITGTTHFHTLHKTKPLFFVRKPKGISPVCCVADSAGRLIRSYNIDCQLRSLKLNTNTGEAPDTYVMVIRNQDSVSAFNADAPNENTPWLEQLAPTYNGLIGKKGDSIYFFDTHLKLRAVIQGEWMFNGSRDSWSRCNYASFRPASDIYQPCFYDNKGFTITIRTIQNGVPVDKVVLYSFINHSISKQQYNKVITFTSGGKRYHWCYEFNGNQTCVRTVLDDSLNILNQTENMFPPDNYLQEVSRTEETVYFQNSHGQVGLASIDGQRILINPVYEHLYFDNNEFFVASEKKSPLNDYYDQEGNLKLSNLKELRSAGWNCYLAKKRNDSYCVYSPTFKVLLNNCSEVLNSQYSPIKADEFTDKLILVKHGKYYLLERGEILKMNASTAPENSMSSTKNQGLSNRLLRQLAKGKSTPIGNNYQVVTPKEILWVQGNGRISKRVKATYADVQPDYTFVISDKKYGILKTENGEWVVQPQPHPVVIGPEETPRFWEQIPDSNGWMLIDAKGRHLLPETVDYPLTFVSDAPVVFKKNGRYGLISEQSGVLLAAENDAVQRIKKLYAFKKGQQWGLFTLSGRQLPATFDAISTLNNSSSIAVFRAGKMGILNDSLEWISPMMSVDSLIKTAELSTFFPKHITIPKDSIQSAAIREISNSEIILQLAGNSWHNHAHSRELSFTDFHFSRMFYDLPFMVKVLVPDYNIQSFDFDAYYFGNRYYSAHCSTYWFLNIKNLGIDFLLPGQHLENGMQGNYFLNFAIDKDTLQLLKPEDLFLEDKLGELDLFLEKETVRSQLFGLSCANLSEVIKVYKRYFTLTPYGIHFYYDRERSITLHYKEIRHLLKHPEAFD